MLHTLRLTITFSLLLLLTAAPICAEYRPLIAFGDPFPELTLPVPAEESDRHYLGLKQGETFTPSQIEADLLLVELLNVHCVHCQMQAPAYNELYQLLQEHGQGQPRIKLIGVAVANLPEEVKRFRERYGIAFPIFADARFQAYRALGARSTPFAIYVRQDQPGRPGIVAGTHLGLNTDYRALHQELSQMATEELAELRAKGAEAVRVRTAITPVFSEEDLQGRVREAFINTGGLLKGLSQLQLRSGRRVYAARLEQDDKTRLLFAEVTSRQSVCDICHDLHFIYVFEPNGRIVGFEPLQITKYGNVHWSTADAAHMRRRLLGQFLSAPRPFDPALDAVSSATISSAIIFDSLTQGEALLEELHEKGYLR